ncbi:PREDICTED: uncharacterized protein LOC107169147 [Diuraphis noxia]|uniref:uncharacterized protein LOC107169147 n=1 Tax=Diuraphis noxia TaxID=143948 RepID=UPI00076385EA|nr:PREDICTED: uncharacterized protein LOC107169147 [Diuraphis noxia]
MQAVLDEFYAQIVDKLERDELIPAYKRSMHREYLATVVDGLCGQWCGRDRRRACEAAVAGSVAYHGRVVRHNGSVCPLGKHHDMLYVVARFAMDADAGPEPVAALLAAIYTCEKTLEKLFEGAVVGSKVARMISGRWTDFGATVADNRMALAFYLDRATRARLLLDGRRMQDVWMRSYRAAPVMVAVATGDLAAVAMLLRYGPDERSVRAAIAYLRRRCADQEPRGPPFADRDQSCLELLLRAVAYEGGAGFGGVTGDMDGSGGGCGSRDDCGGCDGAGAGGSGVKVVPVPPTLLHLARCAVRKALHQNFSLPHGILQLPLPRSLVSYLDLEC